MQVTKGDMPQCTPKVRKPKLSQFVVFIKFVYKFCMFLRSKTNKLQNQQTSYTVYFFGERVAVFLLQKHFKMTPISWK